MLVLNMTPTVDCYWVAVPKSCLDSPDVQELKTIMRKSLKLLSIFSVYIWVPLFWESRGQVIITLVLTLDRSRSWPVWKRKGMGANWMP